MAYELAIFDFDDTILHLGVDWSAVKADILSVASAEGIHLDTGQHLVHIANSLSEKGVKEKIDAVFLRHETECARNRAYRLFPRVAELLEELRMSGITLAIASGNHTESISEILSQVGLLGHFRFICGRDKVRQNKPAPDQLLLILGHLKTPKEQTVFAGDSKNDEGAARAAGIRYVKFDPLQEGDGVRALRELLL